MSSFVVSDLHLNSIIENLPACWKSTFHCLTKYEFMGLEKTGELSEDDIKQLIFMAFVKENLKAVNHRYEGRHFNDIKETDFHLGRGKKLTKIETFKLLTCLNYQCSEHEDYETSLAYKLNLAFRLALISETKEFLTADWSI